SVTDSCRFDAVIYGSDQIWRKQHKPAFDYFDPVFWGEGLVKTKVKIAYAASMGNIEIDTPEDKIFIKHHLGNFHDVSIREKDLLDRLEEELGTRYKHVCDPVFLLTKEQWNTHIDKKYIPTYKYILYYRLQPIVETDKMVDELTKKTGMQIIEMRGYIPFFHYGCCYRLTADAQEFLSLISGAEFVVSTSFHGIALSLIFQKQFFTTFNLKCAGRIKSILKLLELEHHFMNYNDIVENGLNNPINYELVNVKLQPFVDFSRKWLHDQLKVANIEKGLPKD
ncbi:MAG: polysaccharide pyruvyl transferase family protein, partial [Bacteroidaceae bacterium]|nr:polysaccharide pyruvyl transferase family protein [Bacteroidaceae bacterium]